MARFVLSDENVNRYGFRVITKGIDLKDFLKNPVMLYMHDRSILPIGKWADVKVEGTQLTAEAVFDEQDEFALKIKSKVDQGILSACSASLAPVQFDSNAKLWLPGQTEATLVKSNLREGSIVDIPGNATALKLFLGDGLCLSDDSTANAEILGKIILSLTPKILRRMNLVLSALNLGADATEAEAVAAIARIQKDADKRTADTIISLAEQAGLVTAANKDKFVKLAAVAPDVALSFLDFSSLKPVADGKETGAPKPTLVDAIKLAAELGGNGQPLAPKTGILALAEKRNDWGIRKWEREDPSGLLKLKAEHKDVYQEMYSEFYGSKL